MSKPEWVLTISITDPDGCKVHANLGYDSMDKLTGFPDATGSSIIRKLAQMMLDSIVDAPTGKGDEE